LNEVVSLKPIEFTEIAGNSEFVETNEFGVIPVWLVEEMQEKMDYRYFAMACLKAISSGGKWYEVCDGEKISIFDKFGLKYAKGRHLNLIKRDEKAKEFWDECMSLGKNERMLKMVDTACDTLEEISESSDLDSDRINASTAILKMAKVGGFGKQEIDLAVSPRPMSKPSWMIQGSGDSDA
jgi:hypothetical protein